MTRNERTKERARARRGVSNPRGMTSTQRRRVTSEIRTQKGHVSAPDGVLCAVRMPLSQGASFPITGTSIASLSHLSCRSDRKCHCSFVRVGVGIVGAACGWPVVVEGAGVTGARGQWRDPVRPTRDRRLSHAHKTRETAAPGLLPQCPRCDHDTTARGTRRHTGW